MIPKSLFEQFSKKNLKSYYGIKIHAETLFKGNQSNRECYNFIKEHFDRGKKSEILEVDFSKNYKENGKHVHSVVAYLIGIVLKDVFEPRLKEAVYDMTCYNNISEDWFHYLHTWFLTCLYHDTASCVEDLNDNSEIQNWIELEDNIHLLYEERNNLKNSSCEGTKFRFNRYNILTILNYCKYREKQKKRDHGIEGGALLYKKATDNFKKKTANCKFENNYVMKDGLYWRKEHLDLFAYIADAIITHNIWLAYDPKMEQIYKNEGLSELIIKNTSDRMTFAEFPLHFMLCLIDTIEPTKRFEEELQIKEILQNISISFRDNEVCISFSEVIRKTKSFYKWMDSIRELEKWLDVKTNPCKKISKDYCEIIIEINGLKERHKDDLRPEPVVGE